MSLDQPKDFVKHHSPTRDAFLDGALKVYQPLHGFRAGLDSVLLGTALSVKAKTLLELGAGVGVASLVALAHQPALYAELAEIDPEICDLARLNLADNGLAARGKVINTDVTARGTERMAAGIGVDRYEAVIANPPFFDAQGGTLATNAGRARARHMSPATLDLWVKAAATSAAPAGEVIFIHAATMLPALLAAFEQRFGSISVLPICPRAGEPASRVLVRAIKGSRARMQLLSPLVLHESEGRAFRPEVEAIFRGAGRLVW